MGKSWLPVLLLISLAVALGASAYHYIWIKDYRFSIEAACEPSTEECYVRDCEEEYCPPNGLSEYRVFSIAASEFDTCSDNSCLNICPSDEHDCIEELCSEQDEVTCSFPSDEPMIEESPEEEPLEETP